MIIGPALSRRAARVMNTDPVRDLTPERRREFVSELERAGEWERLERWARELIELGEAQLSVLGADLGS